MENKLLVRLPRHTWMDTRGSQPLEAVRAEPSIIYPKIFKHRLVETLPRIGESSRHRFAGSASACTGWIKTLVARTSLFHRRRKRIAEFSRKTPTKPKRKFGKREKEDWMNVSLAAVEITQPIEWHLNRISTWGLLFRTAWILRVLSRIKKKTRNFGIGLKEIITIAGKKSQSTRWSEKSWTKRS